MADILFEDLLKNVFQILLPILIILFGIIPSLIFNGYYDLKFYSEEIEKIAILHPNSEIEIELPFEIEGSEKNENQLALNINNIDAGILIYPNRIDIVSDKTDISNYRDENVIFQRNFLNEELIKNINYNPDENSLIITT